MTHAPRLEVLLPMAFIRCPQCNTVIERPASGTPVCPNCGFGAGAAPAPRKVAAKTAAKKTAAAPTEAPAAAAAPATWSQDPGTQPMGPPSLGAPSPFTDPGAPVPTTSGKAIAAMVVGIVSCCLPLAIPFVGPFLALAGGIVALALGIIANRECTREPQRWKGKGMAVTGIVLGSIMIVLGIIGLLVVFIFLDAIEEAVCEDDPDSEECQQIRDAFAEAGPTPMTPSGARAPFAMWMAATNRMALPA